MSGWQELRAERNWRSALRLNRALPSIFPRVVLARALARPFVPPTPPCNRVILECSSNSSRSPDASTCGSQPSAQRLDLAARGP